MSSTSVPQTPGATATELRKIMAQGSTKVILVGDIHLSDRPPAMCTETYTDDILEMLSWIAVLESAVSADAVVWAGDIFNHQQPARTSHALVTKLTKVAKQYQRPPLVVTGNHDISNHRLESLEKQPLGVMYETGVLQELDGWHETLPIFGVPWQQRWHAPGTIRDAFGQWRAERQKTGLNSLNGLAVTHAPIYPPSVADNVMFDLLPLDEVSEAMDNTGSLYYGHIHEPHGVFEVDGVTYANMGAISRGSLVEYNLARKIQVAIWTPEFGFVAVDVPHRPAEEVFKMAQAQEKKEAKMDLSSFLEEIDSTTLDISSTGAIIDHVRRMNIEEPVKVTSIELLEEATQ